MPGNDALSAEKYALAVKVAGIGLGEVDYLADTITLDDRAAALFGLSANVPVSRKDLHAAIHPEDWIRVADKLSHLLDPAGDHVIDVEHRVVHPDGTIKWISARKQVMFSTGDRGTERSPLSGLVALTDITRHKQDQERIRALMHEVNHRSKNLLTVVQSIANRTFSSGDPASFRERFSQRIRGLVQNTDALAQLAWTSIRLQELVKAQLKAFVEIGPDRVMFSGPDLQIPPNQAQAIGLALHELGTNAMKYGAWSVDGGQVDIAWDVEADGTLCISWTESGGPMVSPPEKSGFGQTVIKDMAAMATDGDVRLEYRPAGVFWQLRMPASALG